MSTGALIHGHDIWDTVQYQGGSDAVIVGNWFRNGRWNMPNEMYVGNSTVGIARWDEHNEEYVFSYLFEDEPGIIAFAHARAMIMNDGRPYEERWVVVTKDDELGWIED